MKKIKLKQIIREEVQRLQKLANIKPPINESSLNEGWICDKQRQACCMVCSQNIPTGTVGAGCQISSANCSCVCISGNMVAPGSNTKENMMSEQFINETLTMMEAAQACLDMVNGYTGEGECTCATTYNGPDDWSATGGGDCAGQVVHGGGGRAPDVKQSMGQ